MSNATNCNTQINYNGKVISLPHSSEKLHKSFDNYFEREYMRKKENMVTTLLKKKYYLIEMVSIYFMTQMMIDLLKTQLLVFLIQKVVLIILIWIG